jgi:hypothetical protein
MVLDETWCAMGRCHRIWVQVHGNLVFYEGILGFWLEDTRKFWGEEVIFWFKFISFYISS